jgi:hypothetical protein
VRSPSAVEIFARFFRFKAVQDATNGHSQGLQGAYQTWQWEEMEIGIAMVPFNDQISKYEGQRPTPVKFQFTLSADKTVFELTFIDPRALED